jgi:hypothetical protein
MLVPGSAGRVPGAGAMALITPRITPKDAFEVPCVDDEGVGPRSSHRRSDDLYSVCAQDLVEAEGELRISVPHEESDGAYSLGQHEAQI